MLLGEPWMVKCFVESKSNGPIVVDFEGETTTFDLGPQDPLGDLVYMMFLEKGITRMSGGGGPIILGVPLSFVNISDR